MGELHKKDNSRLIIDGSSKIKGSSSHKFMQKFFKTKPPTLNSSSIPVPTSFKRIKVKLIKDNSTEKLTKVELNSSKPNLKKSFHLASNFPRKSHNTTDYEVQPIKVILEITIEND